MKKHIFGLALFGLIVGSTVWICSLFIVPVVTVQTKFEPVDERPLFRESPDFQPDLISTRVDALNIDLRDDSLNSKIRLTWNGAGEPPKYVYLIIKPFEENSEPVNILSPVVCPKWVGNQATVETKISYQLEEKLGKMPNYYAFVNACPQTPYRSKDWDIQSNKQSAHPVLLIHRDYKAVKLEN